jgi:hypothetical protein
MIFCILWGETFYTGSGKISADEAKQIAEREYNLFMNREK